MRRSFLLSLCAFAGLGSLFSQSAQTNNPQLKIDPDKAIRIKVFSNGTVMLNGKSVPVEQVAEFLHKEKGVPGAHVLYYREGTGGPPPPNARVILRAVADARLPLRLSTKPDFSDVATVNQKSR